MHQRVNSTSIFILSRFFLRIDHVLFRIFDVRLYHALGSGEVIRELKGRQAGYDEVKAVSVESRSSECIRRRRRNADAAIHL